MDHLGAKLGGPPAVGGMERPDPPADPVPALVNDHVEARAGQSAGAGQAADAGADDHDVSGHRGFPRPDR